MCCEVRVNPKCLPAKGTREQPFARMPHLMQFERGRRVETSATLGAQERLLACVDALVDLYVALIDEPFAAVRAGIGPLFEVGFHVFFQFFLLLELNATTTAEEIL